MNSIITPNFSDNVSKAYRKLRVLKKPKYIDALKFICAFDEGVCVTDIYIYLRIEQSMASIIMRDLKFAGVVYNKRVGKHIFYFANKKVIQKIGWIADMMNDEEYEYQPA